MDKIQLKIFNNILKYYILLKFFNIPLSSLQSQVTKKRIVKIIF